jgi:transposase
VIIFNKLVVMKKRKQHTLVFKVKVVLEALQERETTQELGKKFNLHPTQISTMEIQFLASASNVFEKGFAKNDKEKAEISTKLKIFSAETTYC